MHPSLASLFLVFSSPKVHHLTGACCTAMPLCLFFLLLLPVSLTAPSVGPDCTSDTDAQCASYAKCVDRPLFGGTCCGVKDPADFGKHYGCCAAWDQWSKCTQCENEADYYTVDYNSLCHPKVSGISRAGMCVDH